jgi:3-oxoacyl-[acyl-carrier-protein] synthase-1
VTPASLAILGCGMSTAVGLTGPASAAAIRARIDGFTETRFMAPGGAWQVGAEVPLEEPWRGLPRLARLVAGPIGECLELAAGHAPSTIPLLLCVAEPDRPGRMAGQSRELRPLVEELLGTGFHPASRLIPMGRVGGAVAIREASRLLNDERHGRVIIAGVDSWLTAGTVRAMAERRRLLGPKNANGFVPGEAGAALLVGPDDGTSGLAVQALGLAVEPVTVESEEPLRGLGMTQAWRAALAAAGIELRAVGYRIGALSGEQYFFKEAALATARLLRDTHDFIDLLHPSDCIGEVGAAILPLILGLALRAHEEGWAPGDPVLAFAANDDGRRAALILAGCRP